MNWNQCEEGMKYEDHKPKKKEVPPEQEGRVPGYCSATCTCMQCLREEIKKKEEIKTSDVFVCKLPPKFEHPHWFNGFGCQVSKQHPLYRTSSNEYGWYPPGIHSVPTVYVPLNQTFSSHLAATGMYRNYSLNMSAPDPPTKMC